MKYNISITCTINNECISNTVTLLYLHTGSFVEVVNMERKGTSKETKN
tara:strand:- start:280 stop:423 length:144 start_codon:yes stop_codon:yes gene_type:complete